MISKNILLIIVLSILFSITLVYVFKQNASFNEPARPISYIKEEYLRCITLPTDSEKGECLNVLAEYAYDMYGPEIISEELDTLTMQDRNLWCHETMHYVGWQAYQHEQSVAKAFMQATELCDSAMYHGIMEEYLRQNGLEENIESLIKTVCTDALAERPDFSEGTRSLCYHGIGHGLMYITTSNLGRSLDYCDVLQDGERQSCYGGAFMEHTASKQVGPTRNNKDLRDFSYCESLKEHQKIDCYVRQGSNNFSFTGGEVKPAMELCLELEAQYQKVCFEGVGINNPTPSKSHTQASIDCHEALEVSPASYQSCIKGSLGFVIQLDRGESQGAYDFCKATLGEYQNYCYTQMGQNLKNWLSQGETLETKCSVIEDKKFQEFCGIKN